ncbi:hypothetical protein LXA43DRAFT_123124 [Ganoderma leucocontextum]|nr:hypothetical protein LXA43DRAFT_123124 [Ganoderma leucocontextum]
MCVLVGWLRCYWKTGARVRVCVLALSFCSSPLLLPFSVRSLFCPSPTSLTHILTVTVRNTPPNPTPNRLRTFTTSSIFAMTVPQISLNLLCFRLRLSVCLSSRSRLYIDLVI